MDEMTNQEIHDKLKAKGYYVPMRVIQLLHRNHSRKGFSRNQIYAFLHDPTRVGGRPARCPTWLYPWDMRWSRRHLIDVPAHLPPPRYKGVNDVLQTKQPR